MGNFANSWTFVCPSRVHSWQSKQVFLIPRCTAHREVLHQFMTIFVSLTKKPQKAFLEPYSWQPPSVIEPRAWPFDVTSSCSIVHIPTIIGLEDFLSGISLCFGQMKLLSASERAIWCIGFQSSWSCFKIKQRNADCLSDDFYQWKSCHLKEISLNLKIRHKKGIVRQRAGHK